MRTPSLVMSRSFATAVVESRSAVGARGAWLFSSRELNAAPRHPARSVATARRMAAWTAHTSSSWSRSRRPLASPRKMRSMKATSSSPSRVCSRMARTRPFGRPPGFPTVPSRTVGQVHAPSLFRYSSQPASPPLTLTAPSYTSGAAKSEAPFAPAPPPLAVATGQCVHSYSST